MLLDSREGITTLIEWARICGYVLEPHHKRLAEKYGVDTQGVIFRGPIPTK